MRRCARILATAKEIATNLVNRKVDGLIFMGEIDRRYLSTAPEAAFIAAPALCCTPWACPCGGDYGKVPAKIFY